MRITVLVCALALSFIAGCNHAAVAEEKTPEQGMPFCLDRDTLQEFMVAMVKQDKAWLRQIDGCAIIKGGVRIGIIEEYEGSEIGHVAKVRIIQGNTGAIGYGLMLDLKK